MPLNSGPLLNNSIALTFINVLNLGTFYICSLIILQPGLNIMSACFTIRFKILMTSFCDIKKYIYYIKFYCFLLSIVSDRFLYPIKSPIFKFMIANVIWSIDLVLLKNDLIKSISLNAALKSIYQFLHLPIIIHDSV